MVMVLRFGFLKQSNMDYEKKYKELILWGFIDDISDKYPECNDFEKIVLAFRKNN